MIIGGKGSRLYGHNGISYLDTRNNVAHCGHQHPGIAAAVAEQLYQLNTNTRYLHHTVVELAEKLISTMPKESSLTKVFLSTVEAKQMI